MPSKNATGPTISWPSQWAEHIFDWANTGDPTAVERCPPASARRMPTSCRGRVRMFADLRRVVRRGDPRPHASAIPAGGHAALAPLEALTHLGFGAATPGSWTTLPQPRWRTSALRCPNHGRLSRLLSLGPRGPSWPQDTDSIEFYRLTSTSPGLRPDRPVSLSCHPPLLQQSCIGAEHSPTRFRGTQRNT